LISDFLEVAWYLKRTRGAHQSKTDMLFVNLILILEATRTNCKMKIVSNVKVGPYFNGEELKIDLYHSHRKPSKELLDAVKLRPVYERFPSPKFGRSPVVPRFHIPSYSSVDESPLVFSRNTCQEDDEEYFSSSAATSVFAASVNSINYFIGVWILGLPHALMRTGWLGIIGLLLLGGIMCYTGILLGKCQHKLQLLSYPDILEVKLNTNRNVLIA
jgi:hypothetical protein